MASAPTSSRLEDETDDVSAKHAGCHTFLDKRDDASEIHECFNTGPVQDYLDVHRYSGKDDLVKARSAATCRLLVTGISGECVKTGWVIFVENFSEKKNRSCKCEQCCNGGLHPPKKAWGEVYIKTALSNVKNNEEAQHTKLQFSELPGAHYVPTLMAQKIVSRSSDDKGEWCQILYITHDMELANRLYKVYWKWHVETKKAGYKLNPYSEWETRMSVGYNNDHNRDEDGNCSKVSHNNSTSREWGLHQCLIRCDKNPGHDNFIPTNIFNIRHLPSRYRDGLVVDYVRATSDLTCRLSVSHLSVDRPETWPDDSDQPLPIRVDRPECDKPVPVSSQRKENCYMVGTGVIHYVKMYSRDDNINCKCDKCLRPGTHTPKKTWGEVYIQTACHVVFNTEEARHTKCQFFYDSHETDINTVPTLTGGEVVSSSIQNDTCEMIYVTHDVELLDRLDRMRSDWYDLCREVNYKYKKHAGGSLCILVSHPHGCTKVVSVGTWTQRHTVARNVQKSEMCSYSYNTPTCPGSSGAAVITLLDNQEGIYWFFKHPVHSQGRPGNDNNSGAAKEWVAHRPSN